MASIAGLNRFVRLLIANCQYIFKRVISPTPLKYFSASIPVRARWKPKPSCYKVSFTNDLNVRAAFASATIWAVTVIGAQHVTTLLTVGSEQHIVLPEPVKHLMTVVSGALPPPG